MKPKEMQELDKWLAENVMGWENIQGWRDSWWFPKQESRTLQDAITNWHPTTNIAQAFEVMEKMNNKGIDFVLIKDSRKYWECHMASPFLELQITFQELPSLAICLAAKKAWEAR